MLIYLQVGSENCCMDKFATSALIKLLKYFDDQIKECKIIVVISYLYKL